MHWNSKGTKKCWYFLLLSLISHVSWKTNPLIGTPYLIKKQPECEELKDTQISEIKLHTGEGRELACTWHLPCASYSSGHFKFYFISINSLSPANHTRMKNPKKVPHGCPRPPLAYLLLWCELKRSSSTR